MRVVLYAEGAGEIAGAGGMGWHTNAVLDEESLGAAHELVRRCLSREEGGPVPSAAVQFQGPLRIGRGRIPKGSDLLDRENLRSLLTWLQPDLQPDLAVVLVDEDGHSSRKRMLEGSVADIPGSKVVAVAIREFEAWLVADEAVASGAMGKTFERTKEPETMAPGEAKKLWASWVSGGDECAARLTVARTVDLDGLASRCRAFGTFRGELRHAVSSASGRTSA
jgi:hypothetical protein